MPHAPARPRRGLAAVAALALTLGLAPAPASAEGPPRFAGRIASTADLGPVPGAVAAPAPALGAPFADPFAAEFLPADHRAGPAHAPFPHPHEPLLAPPTHPPGFLDPGFAPAAHPARGPRRLDPPPPDLLLKRRVDGPYVYHPARGPYPAYISGVPELTLSVTRSRPGLRPRLARAYRAGFRDGLRARRHRPR